MGDLSKFCERMRWWCEEGDLGYDQSNRWDIRVGGECDCSSLVIHALGEAGFDTGTASYTGDMSANLCARGWRRLPADISTCRAGDILLNDVHHVCAVIAGSGWGATIAQASIDERGRATGGQSGDQGSETNTKPVYEYRYGWDCILRWQGGDSDATGPVALVVDGSLGPATVTLWQEQVGTEPDGVVSGQLKDCQPSYPALAAVTFEGTGSDLMRRVQEVLGVPNPTGIIARGTICLIQGWLVLHGYDIGDAKAGVLDIPTAKAIQKSLNAREWEGLS